MKIFLPMILATVIAMPFALTGCDRTLSEKTTVHQDSDGNVKEKKEVVTQDPAGNVTVTKEEQRRTTIDK